MTNRLLITVFAVTCAFSASVAAQHSHDHDVILAMEDWSLITGVIHDKEFEPARLWIIEMDDKFVSDPGFDAPSGTFEANSSAGILITKALRKWNEEEEHFNDIASEVLTISAFNESVSTPPSDPGVSDWVGLQLGIVSSAGSLHVHPWYGLMLPNEGIYLLEMRFWNTLSLMPTTFTSEPFWIIFIMGEADEEKVHEAEEWVIENLMDDPVPVECPADLTGDGSVNVFDLLELLGAWGACPAEDPCPEDLNGDGVVNVFDLLELLGAWGPCSE